MSSSSYLLVVVGVESTRAYAKEEVQIGTRQVDIAGCLEHGISGTPFCARCGKPRATWQVTEAITITRAEQAEKAGGYFHRLPYESDNAIVGIEVEAKYDEDYLKSVVLPGDKLSKIARQSEPVVLAVGLNPAHIKLHIFGYLG